MPQIFRIGPYIFYLRTLERLNPLRLNVRNITSPWGNEDTQQLIDILGKYDVKATFFVVG